MRVYFLCLLNSSGPALIITQSTKVSTYHANMPSSKGKPTDPELREQLKEGNAPTYEEMMLCKLMHQYRNQAGAQQVRRRRGPVGCLEGKLISSPGLALLRCETHGPYALCSGADMTSGFKARQRVRETGRRVRKRGWFQKRTEEGRPRG